MITLSLAKAERFFSLQRVITVKSESLALSVIIYMGVPHFSPL